MLLPVQVTQYRVLVSTDGLNFTTVGTYQGNSDRNTKVNCSMTVKMS